MLSYTREHAAQLLALPNKCVLATTGPAGVLATECRCEAHGLTLYLLLPQTSDHLFNLEYDPRIALVTETWELRGSARVLDRWEQPRELGLACEIGTGWHILVRVEPVRLQVRREEGWGVEETIDLPPAAD